MEQGAFLLVPIVPLVPMDRQFDELYPFVYIGHDISRCRRRRVEKQCCLFYHQVRSNLSCNKSGCNSISAINTAGGKRGKRGKLFLLLLNCW